LEILCSVARVKFRRCFKPGQVFVSEWKEQGFLNTSAVVDCTKYGDAHLPYKAITHSSRSDRTRTRTFMRAGSISVTFSVYVCICVNLSFFPSMVCCKYQLVEFLPIIPRTKVHSLPAIYDPAFGFPYSLVFFFFLLFPAVNKVLVSLDGRCLKNKKHSIIIDTKWTKGES